MDLPCRDAAKITQISQTLQSKRLISKSFGLGDNWDSPFSIDVGLVRPSGQLSRSLIMCPRAL